MLLIPVVLVATIAGLLLAPFYLFSLQGAAGLALTGLFLAACFRKPSVGFYLALALFCLPLANLRYPLAFPASDLAEQVTRFDHKLTVVAELRRLTQKVGNRSQLDLEILQISDKSAPLPIVDSCRLRLFVAEEVRGLLPGDRLRFRTRLRQPRLFGTPGEFHWPRYLASQDIALTGWLKTAKQLERISSREVFPFRAIAAWKAKLAGRINAAGDEPQSVLLRALLLGEAKLLPDSVRELLAASGISHLFAISGLHLGLLGVFGYRVLLYFYRRFPLLLNWQPPQRVLPFLLLPLLLTYLLLTGDAISTRRAFCVATLVAVFCLWRYTVNPFRLLLLLALLFLWSNPLLLWHPAWQLSFSGAAGILLWRPIWQRKVGYLPDIFSAPLQLLLVSAAATLATLPLVLVNFHLLAPASLLANLIAVPLVALLALPIGICGVLFSWLPVVGVTCFGISGWLLQLVLGIIDKLLALPGLAAHYLFLSRWQYLSVALLLLPLLVIGVQQFQGWRIKLSALCLVLALFCVFAGRPGNGLRLYMFSVGQGESILLVDEQRQAILIDGGGLYSDRFDVGKRLLAPALGELGIRRLSAVLLTHDHPDHRKGLIFILQQFPVDQFWTTEKFVDLHPSLQHALSEKAVPLRRFLSGWTAINLGRTELQLFKALAPKNKNDSSLVLYLRDQGGLLLTGDLEKAGVNRLLAAGLPGPVSLLKLPHHGSRHSDTEKLLRQFRPDNCLVSAGYKNRYRFPAIQLINELQHLGIPLYRTDLMGTIQVQADADGWRFAHWQDGLFR